MGELWQLSATEAVDKLCGAEVSPLEMVEAAAARITAVEPHINALPIRFFDEARAQAKAFRRQPADHPGWLAGLPIAIKDYNDVGGQLTTYGSPIFAEHRPPTDDRTVATLRANGAIPLAKSNVPEFAGSPHLQPRLGYHPQSLGSHAYRRRLVRGCCGRVGGARSLAREWLLPRRLAAHSGELLPHRWLPAERRHRATGRRFACFRQPLGGRSDGA
jgi:amidase